MNLAIQTDIDIDFADRDKALSGLLHVDAITEGKNGISRHPTGVYFQEIPTDPITGYAAFDYELAADLGYFKIDFLNNHIYENVRNEAHLDELVKREPEWELLDMPEVVEKLAHIHSHFGVVQTIRPRSIEDLAIILALMRPGKRQLLGKSREEINAEIWTPDNSGYTFRKSHSLAYALSIVVQLNLLCDSIEAEINAENV
jgi:hypothetical protein